MPASWDDVRHQARRCQRLRDPDARRAAVRLWFALVREAMEYSPRSATNNKDGASGQAQGK